MDQHLIFLLLGLANGAVYAALALSLVVTYRTSGVVNFGTAAMALLGAYMYAFLREGEVLLPLPFLPKTVELPVYLGFWPAALIAVAVCAAVGLLLYVGLFRLLRAAPPVGKAVASIGVMVVLTGLFTERVGTTAVPVDPILPTSTWTWGDVRITSDRVWFAVVIVVISVLLAAAYRFTMFGLVTRAAAETEKGAYVSGISPDRIAGANWMISASVAGAAGILIAPIVPLTPIGYTLFIVPALAAAILGQFSSLVPAVVGGLAIGMLQSETTYLAGQHTWLPTSGMNELIPLLLILLVLVVRARPLPSRGVIIRQNLGRAPRPRSLLGPGVVATIMGVVAMFALDGPWRAALITSLIMAIICLSSVVVTGYAGQISLAQLTLAGVAGFLLGPLTTDWDIPFPIAPLLAALAATAVGVVVGLPALRIRGLPVAVVTLALGVVIEALWFHNPDYVSVSGNDIAGPELFGLDLHSRVGGEFPRVQFGLLVLVLVVIVAVGVAKLRTSRLGSAMLAVRANERSAAGAGVDVVQVKLVAFAIASFIAGLGGTLLGYFQSNVTFQSFTTLVGLALFGTAYVAGITSVSGGLVGGVLAAGGLVAVLTEEAFDLGEWFAIVTGVGLVITIVKNPEGVVGPIHAALARRRESKLDEVSPRPARSDVRLRSEEPAPGGEVVLSVSDVRVTYGGVVAVDGADLEVRRGTIVGLIGPNGAGKTTLLDAIGGFTPSTGTVRLAGRDLTGLAPHRRVRAGLGRTFQQMQLYDDLTVNENVGVGAVASGDRAALDLDATLALLGLADVAERPVGELAQGRRQLVSIARALIGDPEVLLLDEPAGGLDTRESQWLGQQLRSIRDSGVTIVLIDHDMHLVLNLCDSISVLDFGRVIASGPPSAIKTDPAVAAAYLGATHAAETVAP
ncbi:MAG TPA: branched-chain amino acid ABC transporter permease/ATP-binding protein [Microthrixaceae bacterium]|nr:branched-chain amino acid ABC transporter permease/ATP-binding protein [Microthrixaceae bacterium]